MALSLALARRDDPEAVGRSAGWVLNGKAVAQEALAQRALLARDRDDPAAARLATVRQQLAALTLASPKPGQEAERLQQIDRLTAQERELSKQLGQNLGRPARDDPWVAPDEVRKALPADAVLVEIARFGVFNFQAKGTEKQFLPPHYAAWVIPPAGRGEVRLIDLGAADAIEADVAAVRRAIQPDPAALRERGEPAVETELRPSLEALADRCSGRCCRTSARRNAGCSAPTRRFGWSPGPRCRWTRIAPRSRTTRSTTSSAAATWPRTGGKPAGQALVMADPDYDLDPAAGQQAARQVLRGRQTPDDELALRGCRARSSSGPSRAWPAPRAEAKAIESRAPGLCRRRADRVHRPLALEAVFKAFQRPRIVVLSTHGFFLEDQHEEPGSDVGAAARNPGPGPKPVIKSENPLLRCGLLLAGCNRAQAGDGEDGVLTGLEIVGTDLRGTELVVLSACETGLGEVRNGEGVAGLRQAFQLAGVQTVVATLWQVPDKESARLMSAFFDNLAKGQDKAEALRQAQLAQIKSRRERYGAAHPFFWAAYTVTGQ